MRSWERVCSGALRPLAIRIPGRNVRDRGGVQHEAMENQRGTREEDESWSTQKPEDLRIADATPEQMTKCYRDALVAAPHLPGRGVAHPAAVVLEMADALVGGLVAGACRRSSRSTSSTRPSESAAQTFSDDALHSLPSYSKCRPKPAAPTSGPAAATAIADTAPVPSSSRDALDRNRETPPPSEFRPAAHPETPPPPLASARTAPSSAPAPAAIPAGRTRTSPAALDCAATPAAATPTTRARTPPPLPAPARSPAPGSRRDPCPRRASSADTSSPSGSVPAPRPVAPGPAAVQTSPPALAPCGFHHAGSPTAQAAPGAGHACS